MMNPRRCCLQQKWSSQSHSISMVSICLEKGIEGQSWVVTSITERELGHPR
ncbi:hypothetical protein DPMN_117893 [Dreissena polymorpha]|uniref:Uncharacterized protein n=1 Tax=Dreissena polymorpha TaxID=45954 RepID=A0A9D4GM49_DREPO|nr:hypothetical protein DPMN_117893 [Dreissena polymorpha]